MAEKVNMAFVVGKVKHGWSLLAALKELTTRQVTVRE